MRTVLVLLLTIVAIAAPGTAQTADSRWSRWLGCWQLVDGKAEVCVTRSSGGVTLSTRVENASPLEQTIVADGAGHAVKEAECGGTQTADWSRDGRLLFVRAELRCGNEAPRRVSGLAFITRDGTWLDVQGIDGERGSGVRVRRYRRPTGIVEGTPLSVEHVTEASGKVSAPVLEAAVAESGGRWPGLRGRDLVALDEAGVADAVVDLMVAQTWPSQFQVQRRAPAPVDLYSHYRYFYDPFWAPYSAYYGYGYYPAYYPGYYYYPGSLVVIGGGDISPTREDGGGRAVRDVGYTRVRTRAEVNAEATAAPNAQVGSSGRTRATPTGFTQGDSGGGNTAAGTPASASGGERSGRFAVPK